ncbi:hypothetical protein CIPAW_02G050400 [Carya illinoinensis]|uniref:Uncharacterized protein n=1 Tax=Carya illinoinensis TaxID=32201 RepID=A0A8T1RCM0_CARIL|nr:hypothetical protein CIPAW_02G050400 [Carya illinoinensis]
MNEINILGLGLVLWFGLGVCGFKSGSWFLGSRLVHGFVRSWLWLFCTRMKRGFMGLWLLGSRRRRIPTLREEDEKRVSWRRRESVVRGFPMETGSSWGIWGRKGWLHWGRGKTSEGWLSRLGWDGREFELKRK